MICEACGEANRPGAEFCSSCQAFLGWDKLDDDPRRGPATPGPAATTTVSQPPVQPRVEQPVASTWVDPAPTTQRQDPAWSEPTVVLTPVEPVEPMAPVDTGQTCPACGRSNPAERRFCGKCGTVLPAHPLSDLAPTTVRSSSNLARERAARKAYKQSLPAIYRFRRVGIVVLVVAVVVAAVQLSDRHPVRWAMDAYFTARKDFRVVPVTGVAVDPAKLTRTDTTPANLVNGTADPWAMRWTATTKGASCTDQSAPATITLTFAPTRVRSVLIFPGLGADRPDRASEFVPTRMMIMAPGTGLCVEPGLDPAADRTRVLFDSGVPITQLKVAIAAANPPTVDPKRQRISLREVQVEAFPR